MADPRDHPADPTPGGRPAHTPSGGTGTSPRSARGTVRSGSNAPDKSARARRRRTWPLLLLAYLVALVASHGYLESTDPGDVPKPQDPGAPYEIRFLEIPAMGDDGPVPGRTTRLAYAEWTPEGPDAPAPAPPRPGIVLIHGSPGSLGAFAGVAPRLAARGYRVVAFDLPGFGRSSKEAPSYSIRAHARAVLEGMRQLRMERAHLVGWSLGGGVVLNAHDLGSERVASITLLAAIGAQETEGSGSYTWEHAKYAFLHAVGAWLPEAVPHFGLLGRHRERVPLSRNFWDTDQRPLAGMLRSMDVPVFILHGRNDFLVASWVAREHFEMTPTSSLVMTPHSHFLPFLQAAETAAWIGDFAERTDRGERFREDVDLAPVRPVLDGWFGAGATDASFRFVRSIPWWVLLLVLTLLSMSFDRVTASVGVLLAGCVVIDFGMLIAALALSVILRALVPALLARLGARPIGAASPGDWGRRLRDHPLRTGFACAWRDDLRASCASGISKSVSRGARIGPVFIGSLLVGSLLWAIVTWLAMTLVAGPIADAPHYPRGPFSLLLGFVAAYFIGTRADRLFTFVGRRRAWASISRLWRHEFWPSWGAYLPLACYITWLGVRFRNVLVFTCVNPGIDHGGGAVGESKSDIMDAFTKREHVLESRTIDRAIPAHQRAAIAAELVRDDPSLAGYPVIVKPDAGMKGHAVRLVRDEADFEAYFRRMRSRAIIQRYHPGPGEAGIFWVRTPTERTPGAGDADGPTLTGRIFSVTIKEFTSITGDGKRSLERLVYRNPRTRMQASTILERHRADASRVLAKGETLRVANAGNHAQGTLFRDGERLITPELERTIDELARSIPVLGAAPPDSDRTDRGCPDLGGLDFGRFDVRYASEEALQRGEGLGIVELNGATGESTNIYDPTWSIVRKYRVLFRQWRTLYELGAWRRAQGARPMSARAFIRALTSFEHHKTGSRVAD